MNGILLSITFSLRFSISEKSQRSEVVQHDELFPAMDNETTEQLSSLKSPKKASHDNHERYREGWVKITLIIS